MHLSSCCCCWALLLLLLASCSRALLVTEELVSVMNTFFASIPGIKKGTDSRVGVGFRFGPFADAQVVWELGPQKKTQPLADPPPVPEEYFKRQVPQVTRTRDPWLPDNALPDLVDNSLRQRSLRVHPAPHADLVAQPSQPLGGDWLNRWRAGLSQRSPRGSQDDSQKSPGQPARTNQVTFQASPPPNSENSDADPPSLESFLTSTGSPFSATPRYWLGMVEDTSGRLKSHEKTSRERTTGITAPNAAREPEAHLRMAMASLAGTRSSTKAPGSVRIVANPATPIASPRNNVFRVLRQLWEAGARAVSG